jgi:2-phosphosulfolactate phosphatase
MGVMLNTGARFLPRWHVAGVTGAVVVVDVIRAFTTAAYAFGAGAEAIYLVATAEEALAFVRTNPRVLAMGEQHGRRVEGFTLSNSPVEVSKADLEGRTLVQRTSAGTQGVVAATRATRLWCASLVCASATARAVNEAAIGAPSYVISGRFADRADDSGSDDLACAEYIEALRTSRAVQAAETIDRIANSNEAERTLRLGDGNVHPDDIAFATRIDVFNFAMEATRTSLGICIRPF